MSARVMTYLGRLADMAGVRLPDLDVIGSCVARSRIGRGAVLFMQGDADATLRFLGEGVVKLVYFDRQGRSFTKALVEAGEPFVCLEALQGGEATFGAIALSDGAIEALPWSRLQALSRRWHAWESVLRLALTLHAVRKERREFELLTLSARERWRLLCSGRPSLVKCVPQAELAALIGITPVALSRLKAREARSERASERSR